MLYALNLWNVSGQQPSSKEQRHTETQTLKGNCYVLFKFYILFQNCIRMISRWPFMQLYPLSETSRFFSGFSNPPPQSLKYHFLLITRGVKGWYLTEAKIRNTPKNTEKKRSHWWKTELASCRLVWLLWTIIKTSGFNKQRSWQPKC